MKNNVFLCMCFIVLCACSHKKQPSAETKNAAKANKPAKTLTTNKPQYTNPLFNQYAVFIKSLNFTDPENATKAAEKYAGLFKGQSASVCDTAFLIFSAYYDKLNNSLDNIHFDRIDRSDTILVSKVKPGKMPAKVAKYLKQLNDNGFTIIMEEGDTYVGQDRDFIGKWFYDSVSPVMKVYLEQLNKENKEIYMEDASIVISAKQLVDREIWWEQFVKDNPGFISIADANTNQKSYLQVLLQGTDNTWVMDDKNDLSDFFKDAYSYLLDKYPASAAAKLIAPYYTLLKAGHRYRADSLMNVYKKEGVTG